MSSEKKTDRIDAWLEAHPNHQRKPRIRELPPRLRPLLIDAQAAAFVCGMSPASFYRRHAAGEIGPEPVELGGRQMWRYRELVRWTEAGCPPRNKWREMQSKPEGP
jgi:predicted DNA-binding transcriptional regulator AlpA